MQKKSLNDGLFTEFIASHSSIYGDDFRTTTGPEATDGYRVVFALPELDSLFAKQVIFLADQRDRKPLPAEQGPYRVVVPQETKQARWVRQVTTLKIQAAKD